MLAHQYAGRNQRQRPGPGAQIDWSHPLVRPASGSTSPTSLRGCWLFNEQCGKPRDLVSGSFCTKVNSADWGAAGEDQGVKAFAANDLWDTNRQSSQTNAQGSVAFGLVPAFSPTDGLNHYICGQTSNSAGNFATPEFSVIKDSGNAWRAGWNNATGDRRCTVAASAANCTQGVLQHYAMVWSSAGTKFYRNGVEIASNGTGPATTAVPQNWAWLSTGIGSPRNAGSQNAGAGSVIPYGYFLNRRWSPDEIAQAAADPYAFFLPQVPQVLYFLPAGFSPSSFPWTPFDPSPLRPRLEVTSY